MFRYDENCQSGRLRFLWGVITFGILFFVAVTVLQYRPLETIKSISIPPPHDLSESVGSTLLRPRSSSTATGGAPGGDFMLARSQVSIEYDQRLRLFDEL